MRRSRWIYEQRWRSSHTVRRKMISSLPCSADLPHEALGSWTSDPRRRARSSIEEGQSHHKFVNPILPLYFGTYLLSLSPLLSFHPHTITPHTSTPHSSYNTPRQPAKQQKSHNSFPHHPPWPNHCSKPNLNHWRRDRKSVPYHERPSCQ